jgi:hypothetical protein
MISALFKSLHAVMVNIEGMVMFFYSSSRQSKAEVRRCRFVSVFRLQLEFHVMAFK